MLSQRIFQRRLASALVMEDLESKMKSLIAQTAKLMRPPNRKATPEQIAQFRSPFHRYAARSGIDPNPESIIRELVQYDPTDEQAKFMPWIVRTVGRNGVNVPEDGDSLRAFLKKFARAKKSRVYTGFKDIMQFKTFSDLRDEMMNFNEEGVAAELGNMSKRGIEAWAEKQIEELMSDDFYKVLLFDPRKHSEEIEVVATKKRARPSDGLEYPCNFILRAHATSDQIQWAEEANQNHRGSHGEKFGAFATVNPIALAVMDVSLNTPGSVWCTASPTHAMSYLRNGPMYMFFKLMSEETIAFDNDEKLIGEQVPYALADYNFGSGGFANRKNEDFSELGPMFFFFLCKFIVAAEKGKFEQLSERALKKIMVLGRKTIAKIPKLPPEPASVIQTAVNKIFIPRFGKPSQSRHHWW